MFLRMTGALDKLDSSVRTKVLTQNDREVCHPERLKGVEGSRFNFLFLLKMLLLNYY